MARRIFSSPQWLITRAFENDSSPTVEYYHDVSRYDLLQEAQYTLNDRTMRLSPYVDRPWLNMNSNILSENIKRQIKRPPKKLILTDFGWNHPNQEIALANFTRSLRSRELLQAFIDHPYFDPTFRWSDTMRKAAEGNASIIFDDTIKYVVLMDIETCFESNYPNYSAQDSRNADTLSGRVVTSKRESPCFKMCSHHIKLVLDSPLFRKINASTLIYISCGGGGFYPVRRRKLHLNSPQLSVASISSSPNQLLDSDMGLPPPMPNPITLSYDQRQAIETCDSESQEHRPYLMVLVANRRGPIRNKLFELHNGQDIISLMSHEFARQQKSGKINETYRSIMTKGKFGATPRGDNKFSYRFSETLSAGAIPVVHADEWVLPFDREVVEWNRCAVVIPEEQWNRTVDILKRIGPNQRCQMRQYCYKVYQKYFVNSEATIAGILDSIEAKNARRDNSSMQ